MDPDRAEFVHQLHGPHGAVIDRGHIDPRRRHQPPAEGQPLGGIMVAADEQHRRDLGKVRQKSIQDSHRLGGGHPLVVDIAGDEDPVRLLTDCHIQDLVQNIFLVLQHGKAVDDLSQVEVRKMHQFHPSISVISKVSR